MKVREVDIKLSNGPASTNEPAGPVPASSSPSQFDGPVQETPKMRHPFELDSGRNHPK